MKTSHVNPGMPLPSQGAYDFQPLVYFMEDSSMAGLQDQLYNKTEAMDDDETIYYVLHSVEYQVTRVRNNVLNYSVCLHATIAKKV